LAITGIKIRKAMFDRDEGDEGDKKAQNSSQFHPEMLWISVLSPASLSSLLIWFPLSTSLHDKRHCARSKPVKTAQT
jgi:hypothetical protein